MNPEPIQYCTQCVQPNTRPGIQFDDEGICPACQFSKVHNQIDWNKRQEELEKIADFGRQNNVSGYDCIVGVSGGKDSTRQALYVRDELGLNPLLVCLTYTPEQITQRGVNNLNNLISLGFDTHTVSLAPQTWKRLMLEGFFRYGNHGKSTETALYASCPILSIAYHIPLIILGESPAIMLGDLDVGTSGDANNMKYCNTLAGGRLDDLQVEGISKKETLWYHYPYDKEMEMGNLRIIYLGYYVQDFYRFVNAEIAIKNGLETRDEPPEDVGDYYGFEALDEDFVMVHQMFKFFKLGFGKVTDQVCEAIRLGMMTREEAVDIVKKYDGKCATKYIKRYCQFLNISEDEFWQKANSHRDERLWRQTGKGEWEPIFFDYLK